MKIAKDEIKHIATLAKLEIPEENLEKFSQEFDSILGYFDELNSLAPRPILSIQAKKQPLRQDDTNLPNHFEKTEAIIQGFPEKQDRFAKVPTAIKDHKDQN